MTRASKVRSSVSGRRKPSASALGWGIAAAVVANTLRLRGRLRALPWIEASDGAGAGNYVWFVARGVAVDARTRAAAERFAEEERFDVVDLVPADLPVTRLLDLARMVDPGTYSTNALAPGRGAFQALCVRTELAERAGLVAAGSLSMRQMIEITVELKRHAPRSMGHALSEAVAAAPYGPADRAELVSTIFGNATNLVQTVGGLQLAAMGTAAAAAPVAGAAALAAWSLQPRVATAGSRLSPVDLNRRSWGRGWSEPAELVAVGRSLSGTSAPAPSPGQRRKADPATREEYELEAERGTDRFFEDRRSNCPWCGGDSLETVLITDDVLQHKPGEFRIDRCEACGHRFQNPRLTIEGLDYYYRDFYDGIGAESADFVFGATDRSYVGRVELVKRHMTEVPRRWLDVGTGHGHFCLIASEYLPQTAFDGLDMTDGIDEAAQRGWVNVGHRGLFPEMAPDLAGTYEVVSMHHYLEHTREPKEELAAAATALSDGGLLLIEVPNPESAAGRLLGRWWVPWFQPQHQHLVPHANLVAELDVLGFDLVELQIAESHQPVDLTMATWFAMNSFGPEVGLPWLPQPSTADRVRRVTSFVVGAPVLAASILLDNLMAPIVTRVDGGNTYRLVARKRPAATS